MIDAVQYIQSKIPAYAVSGNNSVVTIKLGEQHTSWVLQGASSMSDEDYTKFIDDSLPTILQNVV